MRPVLKIVVIVLTLGIVSMAFASNNVLEFAGGTMGKVIYDGKMHNDKLGSGKCMECHKNNEPFPMKKPGTEGAVKIAFPHKPGELCGTCHNGEKAFAQTDCAKCHKKEAPAAGGYGAPAAGGYGAPAAGGYGAPAAGGYGTKAPGNK